MIKVGQKYRTKNNQVVEIVKETPQGFEGKVTIQYDEEGKIPGWSNGHYLDLQGTSGEEDEENS